MQTLLQHVSASQFHNKPLISKHYLFIFPVLPFSSTKLTKIKEKKHHDLKLKYRVHCTEGCEGMAKKQSTTRKSMDSLTGINGYNYNS